MRDHPCPHQHHPAGTGSGGGVLVLVAVLALLVLAAPHAHSLRPVVDQLRRAGPLGSLALPTPPGRNGASGGGVCPVQGRVRIGQGWGAPRDGGRRRHQGIDLLAPAGTPLVAVADGRITRASDVERGLGGITLWLQDRAGTEYYYAHNQRNLVHLGQRVRRGQVIAQVGATGNARGGPPHLHFQLHPGGGPPVSPDATVRRWC
jgi:murein DD-endopeptidase MepM/ murein hydrolase activator NlpD